MTFTETDLPGAVIIDLERREDERGFFARTFCQREFAAHGLIATIAQASVAFNRRKGIVRGLHFQYPPASETKVVRCSRGAIFDVIVDLRPESPTYLRHLAIELTERNGRGLYVPARFAHGYQVLEDETETLYHMNEVYTPAEADGLLYNDPRFDIAWPLPVTDVSERDRAWRPLDLIESDVRRRMMVPASAGV